MLVLSLSLLTQIGVVFLRNSFLSHCLGPIILPCAIGHNRGDPGWCPKQARVTVNSHILFHDSSPAFNVNATTSSTTTSAAELADGEGRLAASDGWSSSSGAARTNSAVVFQLGALAHSGLKAYVCLFELVDLLNSYLYTT
ncbi:hypothetical protein NE237_021726 [Protea cynaroides]|uniref:Secreted protein n=1 Tax=Protea cynaroides TaxID=273540 RepID=A0A9Q0K3J3_9MAGN|nr:hypothetical protein NE237_021726 [Protea cynaroides]